MRIVLSILIATAMPLAAAELGAKNPAKPTQGKKVAPKAKDKGSKKAPSPTIYDIVRIWDKDNNRQIEGAEADPLRAAVAESTEGVMKSLDTDNDGRLSDSELAGMNAALKPAPGDGKKKDADAE